MNKLNKKYNLFTAITMVVGIVIGSGIFFKAEKVIQLTGGNMMVGLLAWIVGGAIMIICAYNFAILASTHEKVNGVVDYSEVFVGKRYAYFVGWFMTFIYYPSLVAVLSWLSANYTFILLGISDMTAVFAVAGFYMVAIYALNALAPKLAGKFQVSTTIIKLIPLGLMGIVGLVVGLIRGVTIDNFVAGTVEIVQGNPIFSAIVAVAFAYEGWIIATTINSELVDSKKNLPKALVLGSIIVVGVYILYYLGVSGTMPTSEFLNIMSCEGSPIMQGFLNIFGSIAGSILYVFIIISCLGTTNGLTLGCIRGLYSLSARNVGPNPKVFGAVDEQTNAPNNSAIIGLLCASFWLVFWYGNLAGWYNGIFLDVSELPIVTLYALYVPIFFRGTIKSKDLNVFKRFVMPILAMISSIFMVVCAFIGHGATNVLIYLAIFAVFMLASIPFYKNSNNTELETVE